MTTLSFTAVRCKARAHPVLTLLSLVQAALTKLAWVSECHSHIEIEDSNGGKSSFSTLSGSSNGGQDVTRTLDIILAYTYPMYFLYNHQQDQGDMASRDCYVYPNCLCYNPPHLPIRYLGQAWATPGLASAFTPTTSCPPRVREL